jgi:fucose 4-O-acetylase-like acetyltransferase
MSTQTVEARSGSVAPAAAGAESGAKPRLLYLDNLRTAAITLVVLGHVAVSYGAEGDWYLHGTGQVSPLALILMLPLMAIGAAFMMGLLFLIAGYFTPRSYDRKGPGPFLVDRLKRLGIPLLLFAIVINPMIEYLVEAHTGEYQGSYWSFIPPYIRNLDTAGFGVTWFLEALLIFSIFYILWRLLTQSAPQRNAPNSGAVPGNRSIALFALVLGLATFLVRIWAPVNTYFEPEHLEFAHFPQYVAMFAVGAVAYRRNWLATFSDVQSRLWRWVALVCVLLLPVLAVAAGALTGELDERGAGGLNWLSLAYSIWEGFTCLALVITVLVWFRARFNHQGRLARAMSESSFAVYVLHPIIIVPFALALSGIQINPTLMFLIAAPLAVALCYIIAYYFRKLPLVRNIF